MEVTGKEVLEWAARNGFILGEWQREMILRMDWNPGGQPLRLRPAPRQPVQTRRVQRRSQTRAERRSARKVPQARYVVIMDELAGQP